MTIHNDITVPDPWKRREFDMVLQYCLQIPCFLSLGQVELTTSVLLCSAGAPCQVGGGLGMPAVGHPSLSFLPPIVLA